MSKRCGALPKQTIRALADGLIADLEQHEKLREASATRPFLKREIAELRASFIAVIEELTYTKDEF